jgi:hypothetical protein
VIRWLIRDDMLFDLEDDCGIGGNPLHLSWEASRIPSFYTLLCLVNSSA